MVNGAQHAEMHDNVLPSGGHVWLVRGDLEKCLEEGTIAPNKMLM